MRSRYSGSVEYAFCARNRRTVSLGNLVRKPNDLSFKLMQFLIHVAALSDPRALRGKLNATGSVFDEPKQLQAYALV